MKRWVRWYIGLAVAGLLNSIWLLIAHVLGEKVSSLCTITSTISCEVLQYRDYSTWFDIPVPIFSILFYGYLIAVGLEMRRTEDPHAVRPYLYAWLLSWVGLVTAAYFAYVSASVLKMLCPFCAVIYVINIGLWIVARRMMKELGQPWGYLVFNDLRRIHRSRWVWIPFFVSAIVLIGTRTAFRTVPALVGPEVPIVGSEARMLGDPAASIAVTVFSDFQCPHCKTAAEVLRQLEEEMRGKVRVVYKFYPLSATCNSAIPKGRGHMLACEAATGAYCASTQGRFWAYHDAIFDRQTELTQADLSSIAGQIGLDLKQFRACEADRRSAEQIKKDVTEGITLNVMGTPSVFVNGQAYQGPITLSGLKEAIASAE